MHFKLTYSGSPGNVSATLQDENGTTIDTVTGLANEKSAKAWARAVAKKIKENTTPAESKAHAVYTTISGHDHFNL